MERCVLFGQQWSHTPSTFTCSLADKHSVKTLNMQKPNSVLAEPTWLHGPLMHC